MIYHSISNSISIPRGLKSFMLKNCKVDFLGNSEVAFFFIHPVFSFLRNLVLLPPPLPAMKWNFNYVKLSTWRLHEGVLRHNEAILLLKIVMATSWHKQYPQIYILITVLQIKVHQSATGVIYFCKYKQTLSL